MKHGVVECKTIVVKDILLVPNEMLMTPSAEVVGGARDVILDLVDTAIEHGAAGLAAPQIGYSLRVIVVRQGSRYIPFVNPRILKGEGREIRFEECLSLPGMRLAVPRYTRITLVDQSRKVILHGLEARIAQHEIDHLNGITLLDKVFK